MYWMDGWMDGRMPGLVACLAAPPQVAVICLSLIQSVSQVGRRRQMVIIGKDI